MPDVPEYELVLYGVHVNDAYFQDVKQSMGAMI
jgi:hypothetical protein